MRGKINEWLRTAGDGCIDFDAVVRDRRNMLEFAAGYDSGDHLNPVAQAYEAMDKAAFDKLIKSQISIESKPETQAYMRTNGAFTY